MLSRERRHQCATLALPAMQVEGCSEAYPREQPVAPGEAQSQPLVVDQFLSPPQKQGPRTFVKTGFPPSRE